MGNTNSTSLDFEYNLSVSDYAIHKKYRDFVFGEFFEVKHVRTGELLLMKVRMLSDAEKYRQNSQRFALSHPNLVKIKGFAGKASKISTEPSHKIFVYFTPLPKDLAESIKARKKNPLFKEQSANSKNFFSESELEQIATQLIDVLEYLQNNNINHGDLRPEACFMTEAGKVVICDRQLIYEEELDISLEKNNRKNFLFSPEMFESLTKPGVNFKEPSTKSDVFSLGMTLLECATFRRSASLYEWTENPSINFSGLVNRLDEVQTRYSPKIYQIIAEMLKFDEQSRPDFVKLKRWISGAEALSYRAVSHSPHHKKWPSGPQLNRSNLGPKLNVTSPRVMHNFAGTNFAFTAKNKDSGGLFDSSVFRHNRRAGLDEDEVVEFETEESPKRSHHLANQQHQDSKNAYINIINKNHKPLAWRAPPPNGKFAEKESSGRASNKTLDTYLAGLSNFHDAHTYINGFDMTSTPSNTIHVEFKNEKESTFGAKDLKDKMGSESSSPDTRKNTAVKANRNFIYPVVETGKPNGYLKASSYDANNPFTVLPYTHQQQQPSAFKTAATTTGMDSPTFPTSERFSATSSIANPFIMEAPPMKLANHRSNSDGSYISKLNEERRNEEYFSRHSAVSKPFNPALYLKTPSPYHIHDSPLLSGEQIPASSHLKKSSGKLDTSLNMGSYGEIEQWRSPMDGATYNSILSVNTHSPRTGKNSNNNLQSRPFSPYSVQSDSQQKGFAEACHRLTSQHSSNSIDGVGIEENTPQFKESSSIRKPGYLDDNLAFYNYKTPMERMTYDPTYGSLNRVSSEAGSLTLVKSKSYKDAMPEDRNSIRAEIDMILQNTTLSKRQSQF